MNENETISEYKMINGLYFGKRNNEFKNLIKNILIKSSIHEKYISILLNDNNIKKLGDAFTSDTIDPINNYQIYEQLGDISK